MTGRAKNKIENLLKALDSSSLPDVKDENGSGESNILSPTVSTPSTSLSDFSLHISKTSPSRNKSGYVETVLKKQVEQLTQDNQHLQQSCRSQIQEKDIEIDELQRLVVPLVSELEKKQEELDKSSQSLRLQEQEILAKLRNLHISDAQYKHLSQIPDDGKTLIDHVKAAFHEQTSYLHKKVEGLQSALEVSSESAARAERELSKIKIENARLSATLFDRSQEIQTVSDNLQARVDRLSADLEQALIKVEVTSAKGQMYDELQKRTNQLQDENHRLLVIENVYQQQKQQLQDLSATLRDREHVLEMLTMDKAYLSKQAEILESQCDKFKLDLEQRDQKLNELSKQRQDLVEKLLTTEASVVKAEDARLHKELASLQASTHADIERIRVETAEAYEREARLLRELRDNAVEELSRTRVALADLQVQYEQMSINHGTLRSQVDAQITEMQVDVKQKSFEINHLRNILTEKDALLIRANEHAELLQKKLGVSMAQIKVMEADLNLQQQGHPESLRGPVPVSSQQQPGAVAAQQQEQAALAARVHELEAKLKAAQSALKHAHKQPQRLLLEELAAERARLAAAGARINSLAATLEAREAELRAYNAEKEALKEDLRVLLEQQRALDSMKEAVISVLSAAQDRPPLLRAAAMSPMSPPPILIHGS